MNHPDTYIIYGANSNIGSQLSHLLAPQVKHLILFYHTNTDKIAELFSLPNVLSFSSDILEYEDFMSKIGQINGTIQIENLAAVYLPAARSSDALPLSSTSLILTQSIINSNLIGTIHFLKGILSLNNHVKKTTRIVLLGSLVSRFGLKNGSVYAATKAAIANLSLSVAMEEGANHTLINTVSPGPVESDNSHFDPEYAEFREKYFDYHRSQSCLGKIATPSDVCSLICFLNSLENNHITGEEIFLSGGSR